MKATFLDGKAILPSMGGWLCVYLGFPWPSAFWIDSNCAIGQYLERALS